MTSVWNQTQNHRTGLAPDCPERLFYGFGNGARRNDDLGHDDLLRRPGKFDGGLYDVQIESQATTSDVFDGPETGTENLWCWYGFDHAHFGRLPGYLQVAAEYRSGRIARFPHTYHRYTQAVAQLCGEPSLDRITNAYARSYLESVGGSP